jgi:hypothetical protein
MLNPAGTSWVSVAVEHKTGRIVGEIAVIPVYLLFQGKKILGCQTLDVVILPDYQKGSPFYKLHDLTTKMLVEGGAQLMYGFSITRTLRISIRMLRFKNVFHIMRLVRVLDATPLIEKKVSSKRLAKLMGIISCTLLRLFRPTKLRIQEGYSFTEISSFDERFDRLMQAIAACNKIMVYKDADYLNWRYVKCPLYEYKIFALEKKGMIAGFTVISVQDEDIKRAFILDLLVDPKHTWAYEIMLRRTIQYCQEVNAATVTSWTHEHSSLWNIQRQNGFRVKETDNNLIARPHFKDKVPVDVTDPSNWDISIGDSDYH